MADQAGTILRGHGHCPEYSEIFPTSGFDSGSLISGRTRTDASQVRPRWFGQDLSEVLDSGIGRTQDSRTGRNIVGWCDQDTFRPTSPQPIRRKLRAGDRVETKSDVGRDVRREGARRGTPCKRALFGPEGQNSVSSGSDVAETQLGWPPEDEYPAVALSGGHKRTSISRRQVFEAIVCSNGWDKVTAALQLVSHLEGDTLNVALLVPASLRVWPGVLVGALSEHYGSPGRLVEYRRQFERGSRSPGDDLSVFAI